MFNLFKKKGQDAYEYGMTSLQIRKIPQAEDSFRKAVSEDPTVAKYWSMLGTVLAYQKKTEEAWKVLRRALDLDPHDAGALAEIGALFYDRGEFREAINHLKRCVARDPKRRTAWVLLGQAYLSVDQGPTENCKRAIGALLKAIDMKPNDAASIYNFGYAYVRLMDYKAARDVVKMLAHFDSAAAKKLDDVIEQEEGRDEILSIFDDSVKTDKDFLRAVSYLDQTEHQKAIDALQSVFARYPDSGHPHCVHGIALVRMGRDSEAQLAFQRANEIDPSALDEWKASASRSAQTLYSGGDGSTQANPVVIAVQSTLLGVPAEYGYIEKRHGKKDSDWTLVERKVAQQTGRTIERFTIRLRTGATVDIHFDITAFYGRF